MSPTTVKGKQITHMLDTVAVCGSDVFVYLCS